MRRYNNHTTWFIAFLLLIFSPGCCNTGSNPDLTPPTVTTPVIPPSGATGVCTNSVATATFSEAMNPATLNTTTFTLTAGTPPVAVAGVVTYNAANNAATFTPSSPLALNTLYTATITTGAQSTFGIALASNFVWSFTTSATPCLPPTVVSVAPPNLAVGICPSTVVTATFSEAMNPATIDATTFTLTAGTPPVAVPGVVTYNAPSDTATFTPSGPLALSTLYTATITTGAQDTNGNALASNFVWSFTTSATACTPPTVVSVAPLNLATGICPSTVVTATFSEAMNPATINTTTFTLSAGTPPAAVAGVVTYAASTASFTPSSPLALGTLYTAMITTGAQDTSGGALASTYTWSFTTGSSACTPPTVVSVAPPNLSTGICPNTPVVATFSEAMLASTINPTTFTLTAGTPPVAVAGVVTYNASSDTATFTPSSPLALSTLYTAKITTGAENLAGDPLANDYAWTFTTAAAACQATVPLGTACSFGALGGSTVTNMGPSNVTGDVGVWAGSSITGFPPGTITGSFYADDAVAQTAQGDLTTAYEFAAAAPGGQVLPADIGGETLAPGVYKTTSAQPSLGITGNLTLAGNGVYIFQIVSTLTTAATNSDVILSGGATDGDVFWQVGSSATLGTSTTFAGTIMAQASVSLDTGATLNGRALALTGGVTMLSNPVNVPPCP
jgi:hypothetical protein